MRDELPSESRLCFDAYQVDLRTGELRKHGMKVHLAGRPFQILALLLEQPGELLTRKELQGRLWPADTFVDFEHGVNAAIQTLPRRGYRFIAPVERIDGNAGTETERAAPVRDAREAGGEARAEWVGQIA